MIVIPTVVHVIIKATLNFQMYLIYTAKMPFYEKYRINPEEDWPWESNSAKWDQMLKETLKLFLLNTGAMFAITFAYFTQFGGECFWDLSVNGLNEMHPFKVMIPQIYFCMLCEDAYYYVLHRIFHLRAFYKYHKLHHRYTINVSIAAEYTHPIDFLVVSLVSIAVGPLILGKSIHFYTWLLYFTLRTVESIDSHCGYEFPWSPVKCLPL